VTTLVAVVIGILYGAIAGYAGGRTDQVMMRVVDVLYALPLFFAIIILVTVFGRNIFLVFLAIGAVEWLTIARIVRGQTLSAKQTEYVEAARALGASPTRIVLRHIVPNVIGPVIVFSTLLVPTVILVESFLSFLGLGVQEPSTSWGLLISQGVGALDTAPWLLVVPAAFLAATMFAFNFIGDGLRDALDPKDDA
jgi:oligopeptide transport system permease protein